MRLYCFPGCSLATHRDFMLQRIVVVCQSLSLLSLVTSPPSQGELFTNTARGDFTPQVVNVQTGEDVAGKILICSPSMVFEIASGHLEILTLTDRMQSPEIEGSEVESVD